MRCLQRGPDEVTLNNRDYDSAKATAAFQSALLIAVYCATKS